APVARSPQFQQLIDLENNMYAITEEERAAGSLNPDKLASIVGDIGQQGYAVVAGLVSGETRQLLMESVREDAEAIHSTDELTPHEKHTGQGHLQLGLRRRAPYVRPDLLANPLIEHIVAGVLGEHAWLGFYNGNINMPGSTSQPLHFDRPFTWKTKEEAEAAGENWPPRATTLSCSIALEDITTRNAATEIYPGTHRETIVTQWPRGERPSEHPELLKKWGPPARMEIPAGGVCFRDPRMWHRGMPNTSDQVRPMIAMTFHTALGNHWRGTLVHKLAPQKLAQLAADANLRVMDDGTVGDGRLVFEESARAVFDEHPSKHAVGRNVRFVRKLDHTVDAHLVGGARVLEESAS
ncbi:MAG: phytanoyl-CoA dioxygenase family protein, partial [Pseudomonadota bacterium]